LVVIISSSSSFEIFLLPEKSMRRMKKAAPSSMFSVMLIKSPLPGLSNSGLAKKFMYP